MGNNFDIYDFAHHGLKLAEQKGPNLKCAEIFFEQNSYINMEIEENSIKNSEIGDDHGISIRVINKQGSLGFAFTNKLEKKSFNKVLNNAIKMMNVGTSDTDFKNLPNHFEYYPEVKNLFDKNLKNLRLEDSLDYMKEIIAVCDEDDLAISQSASFVSNYTKTSIFNSNGLEISGKDTVCSISSYIIVKDKVSKETSFGYDWQSKRNLLNLEPRKIAENALKDAKRNLNRKKIKKMKIPIILTPKGTISLILRPIASAINGENFQYQRSFLVNKRDQIIGSQYLSIEDNGLIDGAVGSSIFDGEGVPCKNKKIIDQGKFLKNGLLHNSYTSGKEGVESSGNASRNSYSSIPSIGITNFIMSSGDFSLQEILQEVKKGILFDYTGDSPNITTGDFSGLILHGNLIENGEIKEPLNETMIGINLLNLFQNIEAISKEFDIYNSFQAPYVKIKDVQIIGGEN